MEGDWREGRGPVRRTEGGRWEGQKGAGGPCGKDGGTLREWKLPLPLRERVGVRGRVMGTPREEEGGLTGAGPRNNSRS